MGSIAQLKDKVKHLKVLFVDDEKDIREGAGTFLRKFFNNVVVCSDGIDGLEEFTKQNDFDIVVTDIAMPRMDGIDMIKEIKKVNPDVYVVFLTASRGLKDLDKKLSNSTFHKPFSFDDMKLMMQKLSEI